jgi:membrane-bound lytic murein transglycosylase B
MLPRLFAFLSALFLCIWTQTACMRHSSASGGEDRARPDAPGAAHSGVAPLWLPLLERLGSEGIGGPDVDAYFAALGAEMTQEPMGRKVREIYSKTFLRPPPDPAAPRKKIRLYKGVVTEANARRCRDFLAANPALFARARKDHGVEPAVLVSLLFVETRLGTAVGGGNNALHTLASMAVSKKAEQISGWIAELPEAGQRLDWIEELMRKRSEWAYREMKALVLYARENRLDTANIPGSFYGAIGYCQFMPGNIAPYGVDGDGDGVVNLFSMPDAVASVANYLGRHGWKAGMGRKARHKVLRTYNHVDIYADTILALADLVAGPPKAGRTRKPPSS